MSATTTASSSSNARKVSRLLEINPDEEFLQGLHFLSSSSSSSTPPRNNNNNNGDMVNTLLATTTSSSATTSTTTANNAKIALEQTMLHAYESFLESLGEADRRFLEVSQSVEQLSADGNKAREVLRECASSSGALLARVDGLVAELNEVQQREQRISSFIRSFQISDQDALILRKGEVSADFLEALAKLQNIHDSCKKFSASSSSNNNNNNNIEQQQAAIEVMESTFLLHMSSLEKVSAYIASAAPEICGGSGDAAAIDHATLFVDAVRALQSNPGLWAKAVHEIARVRRPAVLRRLAAQSAQIIREANSRKQQQQQNSSKNNINSSSNNKNNNNQQQNSEQNVSLRILGDLCAWLDESAVDERESASAFFVVVSSGAGSTTTTNSNSNASSKPQSPTSENQNEMKTSANSLNSSNNLSVVSAHFTLQDYLDSVFDAAARQLKQRSVEIIQELVDFVWPRNNGSIMMAVPHLHHHGGGGVNNSTATTAADINHPASTPGNTAKATNVPPSASSTSANNNNHNYYIYDNEVVRLLDDASRIHSLVSLFKSESLLGFYGSRISDIFGKSSAVVSSLNDARLESMRYFFELLQGISGAVRVVCSERTDDLSTQSGVSSGCGLLRSLLEVIEQSTTPQAQRGVEAAPLLSALLDPIYTSLEQQHLALYGISHNNNNTHTNTSKNQHHHKQDPSSSSSILDSEIQTLVYSINTLCVALSSILPFEFANQKQQNLTDLLEICINRYTSDAIAKTCERLELDVAHQLISQQPRPTKDSVTLAMKVFFAGIFAGEGVCPLPVPHLEAIQPIRVRERCRREIVEKVCEMYDEIYDIVQKDIEPDENSRKVILHHTPEQLRLLLE